MPALVAALRERDEAVRGAVKEALAAFGAPAVQPLVGHARGADTAQRRTVAEILGELEDAEGIDWLVEALGDPDAGVREQAAVGLGKQKAVRAIPRLLAGLRDPDARVRARATAALGEIGLPAVGPLTAALTDDAVRPHAIQSLVAVGSPAVEPLVAALRHPRPEVRGGAADTLGEMGEAAATPALVAALSDAEPSVQWRAACALEMFGEDVGPAHEAVQAFLAARQVDLGALAGDRRGALKRGQEWPLILALERHGTPEMAEELLAAGSPRVRAAAERWARMRGYVIAPASKRPAPPGKARPPRRAPRPGP
jgi:HEAT repeat protein